MPERVGAPPRVTVDVRLTPRERREDLRRDVLAGLTRAPKSLPPKWLYDERGSELFDEITRLPEYYLTRRERSILGERADEIAKRAGAGTLVELGSGTSEKTRFLLDALVPAGLRCFVALDVSETTLRESAARIAAEYARLEVHAVVGDLERHLEPLPAIGRCLVAFLGSSIGNFAPSPRAALLSRLRAALEPGDALLLGLDLVKDRAQLVAAYDDAAGVTAEFNRNVLHVLNRELAADFVPDLFEHVVRWDAEAEWIELALRARKEHVVRVGELTLEVPFAAGEELRTEISAKFRRERVEEELHAAAFEPEAWWTDAKGDFALSLSLAG